MEFLKWLLLAMFCESVVGVGRSCRVQILRSFGYRSRHAPNRFMPLCPSIPYNCCTNNDIMKMHKMWVNVGEKSIRGVHESGIKAMQDLPKLISSVMAVDFRKIADRFITTVNPPMTFAQHLNRVVGILSGNRTIYANAADEIVNKKLMENMYREVRKWRQSVLCSLCSWNNNPFIDTEGRIITIRTS